MCTFIYSQHSAIPAAVSNLYFHVLQHGPPLKPGHHHHWEHEPLNRREPAIPEGDAGHGGCGDPADGSANDDGDCGFGDRCVGGWGRGRGLCWWGWGGGCERLT